MINPTGSNVPGYVDQAEALNLAPTPPNNVVAGAVTQVTNTSQQLTDDSQGESLPKGNGLAIYTAFSKSADNTKNIDAFVSNFSPSDLADIHLAKVILSSDSTLILHLGGGQKTYEELNNASSHHDYYCENMYSSLNDLFSTENHSAASPGNETGGNKLTSNLTGSRYDPEVDKVMPAWIKIEQFDVTNLTSMTTLIQGISDNWQDEGHLQQACIALLMAKIKALPSVKMPELNSEQKLLIDIGERLQQNLRTPAGN